MKESFKHAPVAAPAPHERCAHCAGTGVEDDGEVDCSDGGIPFSNGPIQCVKECHVCKGSGIVAAPVAAQEPVLHVFPDDLHKYEEVMGFKRPTVPGTIPLFAAPAAAPAPLNVDKTDDLARKFGTYKGNQEWVFSNANLFGFARAVLKAHAAAAPEPAPVAAPAQSLAEWLEKGPEPAPSAEALTEAPLLGAIEVLIGFVKTAPGRLPSRVEGAIALLEARARKEETK